MRKFFMLALCAVFVTSNAWAALAPEYYERARRDAADVVVINVARVDTPPARVGHGQCTVHGTVRAVERGATYSVGQAIVIEVPCVRDWNTVPMSGTVWQEVRPLQHAPSGRAWLTNGRLALDQYELLSTR